ncbi:MAG: DUF262 domain-containing HNH endonuclease family protein [Prolixibacteraceae bacterium]|nr:DUF262 domain-containing HNH endonuclease family protein [Prolixibacteraceae bacterium]
MKGQDRFLSEFIDGARNRFIIPVYQRNYDWKKDNCVQLFNDLVKTAKYNKSSHFFGSVVYGSANNGNRNDYLIIDGQQRLTSVMLILAAIVNLIKEGIIKPEKQNLCDYIEETFLMDKYNPGERKMRLKPIKNDCHAFDNIIVGNKDNYDHKSNVTTNYLYFYERIQLKEIPLDDLCEAIEKLKIIDIYLEKDDEPQSIFESLNSTGLDLEESDKIRNYVLMGLNADRQEEYYENYWNPIEKLTSFKVSTFVRDYLSLKQGRIPVIDNVHPTFKDFIENPKAPMVVPEVLAEMVTFARINHEFNQATKYSPKICTILKRLAQMDMSVINSYLMAFFKYAEENTEQEDTYLKVLSTIESFIFRRLVCSYGTNALNKIFCTLHKDVLKLKSEYDNYSDVFIYILLNKKSSSKYPDDVEFKQALLTRNIYSMNSKNKMYLFNRLENRDSKEKVEVIKAMTEGTFSVEHIMPQTLTEQWKKDLGEEHDRIYNEWLNTLGNLTLTGYNSKYKNRPFGEKRDIKDGFKDSNLRLNSYLSLCDKWGEAEMTTRRNQLWQLSNDLWKYPATSFEPVVQFPEMRSLDEDFVFKGNKINSFTFLGTQYKVSAWSEMIIEVTKLIYEIDSAPLYQLIDDASLDFLPKQESWNTKIGEGLYLNIANSTMAKIRILKKVFSKYELDESELEFGIPIQSEPVEI